MCFLFRDLYDSAEEGKENSAVEFDTAVARLAADDDTEEPSFPFTVNERDEDDKIIRSVDCFAYPPEDGNIIMLMADVMSRRAGLAQQVAGFVDFLTDVLDDDSKKYVVGRLMDRNDPFGIDEVREITNYLMEQWTGRPTQQPSDFLPSRKTGGQKSTRRTSKSTSSASRRTAS